MRGVIFKQGRRRERGRGRENLLKINNLIGALIREMKEGSSKDLREGKGGEGLEKKREERDKEKKREREPKFAQLEAPFSFHLLFYLKVCQKIIKYCPISTIVTWIKN